MKNILVIGAGIGQFYLSKKIKERGDYLICITLPGKQPVIDIADKVYYHDVFDKEGCLIIAKEEGIDAVVSDQNDMMMPTVAYIAEKMGLHGLRTEQVNAFCNKNVFRDNCDNLGIPVPKHAKIVESSIPEQFKDVPYPWIVKPADSQSSVGVEKVYDEVGCIEAIKKAMQFSKTGTAILEEFFDGKELVAEGFIYKGKYYNLGFADRKYFKLENIFIPSQTVFPSNAPQSLLDEISSCEQKMAEYVNPEFAIVHSEYLYNEENDEFMVVESALRGGGVYISSHLIPLYCGININEVLLDCIVGKPVDIDSTFLSREQKAAGYICFYLPKGTITQVEGIDILKEKEYVKMMCVDDVRVGEVTQTLTHKGQRLGPIIISGQDKDDIVNKIEEIQEMLKVVVEDENGEEFGVSWE
ncbi:MAG: ATP-grasp domain-containing protein [Prevotella sp.]|nr:ATP-grasp domain-containing protein [Prevotella sp.]